MKCDSFSFIQLPDWLAPNAFFVFHLSNHELRTAICPTKSLNRFKANIPTKWKLTTIFFCLWICALRCVLFVEFRFFQLKTKGQITTYHHQINGKYLNIFGFCASCFVLSVLSSQCGKNVCHFLNLHTYIWLSEKCTRCIGAET